METFYSESITANQAFWGEADTDTRFFAGDQTLFSDIYGNLPSLRKKQFSFNRIRRVVNMISGSQRNQRKSTIVVPVENGDAETADQFTKILLWTNQQEQVLETISESFEGALVTGLNFLQVWVDYRTDPISGTIKVDTCPYNSFIVDPYFRKADLSDCNALWKRTFLTKREVLSLLPNKGEELTGMLEQGMQDGKFQFAPETYNVGPRSLLTYDEFYYRDYRTQQMLVDTQTGESLEWRGQDEDKLKLFLQTYPQTTMIKAEVPTVKLAIVVQGKVMFDGPNPLGVDKYPFVPVFGYYSPELPYLNWRIQGVVRGLRDAQYLYNRRKAIELDILESQVNSGFIYKENSLVNPKDIFMSGQGKGIALKQEANIQDVVPIMAPAIPQSMIELSNSLARELQEISGVNEELLGSATDDKAGVLSMLRQSAGKITLCGLFDQLDRSQRLLGKLMIDIIQANFTPGKVARIIDAQPTQQFYNKAFGKYDAAVEEGLNTTTQRQMQFAQLLELKKLGVMIPDAQLLEASTLQEKKKLTEAVAQAEQGRAQSEQMQMQAAVTETQARTELAQARAVADRSLGIERVSRVAENEAMADERRAAAVKDREAAMLDMVRTLKELEGIDLSHLKELVTLNAMVKAQEAPPATGTPVSAPTGTQTTPNPM
jgi:hypothetical protein